MKCNVDRLERLPDEGYIEVTALMPRVPACLLECSRSLSQIKLFQGSFVTCVHCTMQLHGRIENLHAHENTFEL